MLSIILPNSGLVIRRGIEELVGTNVWVTAGGVTLELDGRVLGDTDPEMFPVFRYMGRYLVPTLSLILVGNNIVDG